MLARNCATCRLAVIADQAPSHCRATPPRALDAANSAYPVIRMDWWCGLYRRAWRRWWRAR